jgi:hypothetical protein
VDEDTQDGDENTPTGDTGGNSAADTDGSSDDTTGGAHGAGGGPGTAVANRNRRGTAAGHQGGAPGGHRGGGRGGRRGGFRGDPDGVGWILGDLDDGWDIDDREVVFDPDQPPAPPPAEPPEDEFFAPESPTPPGSPVPPGSVPPGPVPLGPPPGCGPPDHPAADDDPGQAPGRGPVQDQTRPEPPRPDAGDPWTGLPPPTGAGSHRTAPWDQPPPSEPPADRLSTWDIHPCADDSDDPADPDDACPTCDGTGHAPSTGGPGAGAGAGGAGLPGQPTGPAAAQALLDAVRAGRIKPEKLFPTATLYLHLSAHALWHLLHPTGHPDGDGDHGEPCPHCAAGEPVPAAARAEGRIGPALADQVRAWLGHRRVTVKPVIDLTVNHAVDGYEVPAWMAEALHLSVPGCCFPHDPSTSRAVDIDHTKAYAKNPDGTPAEPKQTRLDNLGGLHRRLHRVKTHKPGWAVYQPHRGVYLWRTPHGHWYRVDNTGTHRLGQHRPDRLPPARGRRPERGARRRGRRRQGRRRQGTERRHAGRRLTAPNRA